jgi:hypothetical protein
VAVNDSIYGGTAGAYGTFSAGNPSATEIAVHEMGHFLHGLADEYGGNASVYPGGEPGAANLTTNPAGQKWAHWLGYRQPGVGVIGAYEGGGYYEQGIYRPSPDSKMRSLYKPFNAVSREKIVLDIYRRVDPLDGWLANQQTLINPETIWVDAIDPNVIDVQWTVDGVEVLTGDEEVFVLAEHALTPGQHVLTARVFDPTDWVRIQRDLLEQSVTWTILSLITGDANGDGQVSLLDFDDLKSHLGQNGDWEEGDFDRSGSIDLDDFQILKANFGQSAVAVPEPGTMVLWILGMMGLAFRGRAELISRRRAVSKMP